MAGGSEKSKKRFDKLLVPDLDETIIYGTEEPLDRSADFLAGKFHVYRRPCLAVAPVTDSYEPSIGLPV